MFLIFINNYNLKPFIMYNIKDLIRVFFLPYIKSLITTFFTLRFLLVKFPYCLFFIPCLVFIFRLLFYLLISGRYGH